MTTQPWPRGLITALVTPLRNDQVDSGALETLIDHQVANGAAGVVVTGGTGEHGAMSLDERAGLIADAVRFADGRVPVIAATGCLSTRDTIRLSRTAEAAGVFGLLIASPFGEPIGWHERQAFYAELDAAVTTPIMIYNTPPAGLLDLEQIQQLAALSCVSAVKDSSGDPELMGDLLAWRDGTGFSVYVGKDSYLLEAIACGADGVVFGVANFLPSELSGLIAEIQMSGVTLDTLNIWSRIRPLLRQMERASNYVGLCKAGLALRGIDAGEVRKPYLMPGEDEVARLREALDRIGRRPVA